MKIHHIIFSILYSAPPVEFGNGARFYVLAMECFGYGKDCAATERRQGCRHSIQWRKKAGRVMLMI